MPNEKDDYAALLRQVRSQLQVSQEDLARELGVSFATVNRWENRKTAPSRLAQAQIQAFCERMTESGELRLGEGHYGRQ